LKQNRPLLGMFSNEDAGRRGARHSGDVRVDVSDLGALVCTSTRSWNNQPHTYNGSG